MSGEVFVLLAEYCQTQDRAILGMIADMAGDAGLGEQEQAIRNGPNLWIVFEGDERSFGPFVSYESAKLFAANRAMENLLGLDLRYYTFDLRESREAYCRGHFIEVISIHNEALHHRELLINEMTIAAKPELITDFTEIDQALEEFE